MFHLAKKAAIRGEHRQHKVGAVIVNRAGNVISMGFNSYKSHPLMGPLKTLHAEVSAVTKVKNKQDLQGAEIFVYRGYKDGKNAMSKPCPICEGILRRYGVKRVYYTTHGGFKEETL